MYVPVYSSSEGGNGGHDSGPNVQGGRGGRGGRGGSAQQFGRGAAAGGRGGGGGTRRFADGTPMSAPNADNIRNPNNPHFKEFAEFMRKKQAKAAAKEAVRGRGEVWEEEDSEDEDVAIERYMEEAEEAYDEPSGPDAVYAATRGSHARATRGREGGSPSSSRLHQHQHLRQHQHQHQQRDPWRAASPLHTHQHPSAHGAGEAPPTKGSIALMKQNARQKQLAAMGGGGGGGGGEGRKGSPHTRARSSSPAPHSHHLAPSRNTEGGGGSMQKQQQQHTYKGTSAGRKNVSQQDRGDSRVRGYASRGRSPSPPPYSLAAANYKPQRYDARGGGSRAGMRDRSRDRHGQGAEVGRVREKSRERGSERGRERESSREKRDVRGSRGRDSEEERGRIERRRAFEKCTRAGNASLQLQKERERERGRGGGGGGVGRGSGGKESERERERRRSRSYSPLPGSRGAAARGPLPPVSNNTNVRTELTPPRLPTSAFRSATFASASQVLMQAHTRTLTVMHA